MKFVKLIIEYIQTTAKIKIIGTGFSNKRLRL